MVQYRACIVGLVLLAVAGAFADQGDAPRARRARPPQWDRVEIEKAFYRDAFEQGLIGQRPSNLDFSAGSRDTGETTSPPSADSSADRGTKGGPWSSIVSATTIEDEVKALKLQVDAAVTTPRRFSEGGYMVARQDFAVLAILFAIIDEYDLEIRWKIDSATASGLFASAARICQLGTDQAYGVAKSRKADLQDLVGGGRLPPPLQRVTEPDWADAGVRAPLMLRLKTAHEVNLSRWVATESEFSKNDDRIIHEAEVIAALSVALTKDGMEDADDDDYAELCDRLKKYASRVVVGVRTNNYESARQDAAKTGQTCGECHESYR